MVTGHQACSSWRRTWREYSIYFLEFLKWWKGHLHWNNTVNWSLILKIKWYKGEKYKEMPTSRFDLNILLSQIKYYRALLVCNGKVRVKPPGSATEALFVLAQTRGKRTIWTQRGSYTSLHHQEQRRKLHLQKKYRQNALGWTIWNHSYWLLFPDKKNNFKMCNRFNNSFHKGDCGLFHFFLSPMLEQKFPGGSKTDWEISSFSHPSAHHRVFASVPWDLNGRPAVFWDPAFSILTGLSVPVFTQAEGVGSRWESVFLYMDKVIFL